MSSSLPCASCRRAETDDRLRKTKVIASLGSCLVVSAVSLASRCRVCSFTKQVLAQLDLLSGITSAIALTAIPRPMHRFSSETAGRLHCSMAWKKQETDDRLRKTKVDASLGPASWCEEKLKEMILAGTDILRLICSHRRGGDFERVYPLIRKIAKALFWVVASTGASSLLVVNQ